ncbi:anti-sigma regulatory factor (Ser/Thr protein kinase) [Saccharothrix tamanrassetensis]|uniref:Anti-sigma regulatory factor (Ser/Thr protein kinase) n=1 Tax=Saccharothrix tamanrassetensis TaxID=1051531 RepID=A0A841CJ10_9PSEU|nr:ATP-binding protein [Saccharothrix tamanrassetensis]MBB5957289.1 anti-sigma regulatory factor (Ser/Thr protein kinase) [Saccharothrix tamanrassetensis]
MVAERAEPLTLDIPASRLSEVVAVRRWAGEVLGWVGYDSLMDLTLVVTELVSNVYDHALGPCRVRMTHNREPCRIRVEVDDISENPPVVGRSRLGAYRGRGMTMVSALSEEWGFRLRPEGGKTVWAVIDCGADPGEESACE